MSEALTDFAARYAAAWSSQNPATLASFYAVNGSLSVNGGPPSVGRAAITATARGFMTAFPDMLVKMDKVSQDGSHAVFHWTWTGTNTGPGGTGKSVRIHGHEEWTIGGDGLIAESKGHFDDAEDRAPINVRRAAGALTLYPAWRRLREPSKAKPSCRPPAGRVDVGGVK